MYSSSFFVLDEGSEDEDEEEEDEGDVLGRPSPAAGRKERASAAPS